MHTRSWKTGGEVARRRHLSTAVTDVTSVVLIVYTARHCYTLVLINLVALHVDHCLQAGKTASHLGQLSLLPSVG